MLDARWMYSLFRLNLFKNLYSLFRDHLPTLTVGTEPWDMEIKVSWIPVGSEDVDWVRAARSGDQM